MIFYFFTLTSPWKRAWPFICINFTQRDKFTWKWPSNSGEEDENVKKNGQQTDLDQKGTLDSFGSL